MEVKPVKQSEKPKYPLKTELNEEELKKQIPKRWTASPAAIVALGTLAVVALAGCAPEKMPGIINTIIPPTEASVSSTSNYVPEGTTVPAMVNVAPLFIHGEGIGAFGCMMVAPPAFLSEDEALTVINDAAKEYGLHFSVGDTPELTNVLQPLTNLNSHLYPDESAAPTEAADTPDTIITLKADFSDNEHGIAIEYISTDDVKVWSQGEARTTIEKYKTLDAAAQLSEALEIAIPEPYGSYNVGVLYDPCTNADIEDLLGQEERDEEAWDEAEARARETAEEQLKAQAKDFFEWLKSQGVI